MSDLQETRQEASKTEVVSSPQKRRPSAFPLDSLGFGGYTSPVGRGQESKSLWEF